jgi:hypothetical protein
MQHLPINALIADNNVSKDCYNMLWYISNVNFANIPVKTFYMNIKF